MELQISTGMRDNFTEGAFKIRQLSQEEMILRIYPEYDLKRDWVLWIIFELYHDMKPEYLECDVKIQKKDNSYLNIPYKIAQPYPNKQLYQVCKMTEKPNAKRVFAMPLVFHTFESLQEIVNVSAKWSFFEKYGCAENNCNQALQFMTTEVNYPVSFQKNDACENAHMFTLHSKAISLLTEYGIKTEEEMELYLSKFDFVAYSEAVIEINKTRITNVKTDNTEYYKTTGYSKYKVGKMLHVHESKMKNFDKQEGKIILLAREVNIKNAVQYYPMFCTKSVTLTATEIADIAPEPAWGFARIF